MFENFDWIQAMRNEPGDDHHPGVQRRDAWASRSSAWLYYWKRRGSCERVRWRRRSSARAAATSRTPRSRAR